MKKRIQKSVVMFLAFGIVMFYTPSVFADFGSNIEVPASAVELNVDLGPEGAEYPSVIRPIAPGQRLNQEVAPAPTRTIIRREIGTPKYARYERDPGHLDSYDPNLISFTEIERYTDPDFAEGSAALSPFENRDFDSFNVIAIVNRTDIGTEGTPGFESAQTVRVYDRSLFPLSNGLRYYWKVSSGARLNETPTGHFPVYAFSSDYHSRSYPVRYDEATNTEYRGGAGMAFAVFISEAIALHNTDASNYRLLGTRQSHGCIRLTIERATALYHLMGHSGWGFVPRVVQSSGALQLDRDNQVIMREHYKALIIIR